ncbi:hypothetical protein PsYK624_156450 [Phanerochaete sordida]|uniref:Uncharacterized protein n=1 Tax=Phanerochaete sordida TaxID=48140 RepID=A0A9P3GR95_9APHY|nr:hypothetical protein PsYK624_156450 [Phanerochaete sordida]
MPFPHPSVFALPDRSRRDILLTSPFRGLLRGDYLPRSETRIFPLIGAYLPSVTVVGPIFLRAETCWSANAGGMALTMYHDEPILLYAGMTRTFDVHSPGGRT